MKKLIIPFIILTLIPLVSAQVYLSISRVDFLSYDDVLKDRAWLIYLALTGQSQTLVGTWSSDQINQYVSPEIGKKVQYDFSLKTTIDSFTCEYPITRQYEYVWDYDYEYKDLWFGIGATEWQQECYSKPGAFAFGKLAGTYWYYCFWRTKRAELGRVEDPRTHFKSTLTLSSHGDTKTATIDSHSATSVNIDNTIYASWTGYLGTDEECPTAQAKGLVAMYENGWKLTDEDDWNAYKIVDMGMLGCLTDALTGAVSGGVDSCILNHDSYASRALQTEQLTFYMKDIDKTSTATTSGTLTAGKVAMEIPKLLKFPTMVLRVKADWLGVIVPKGIPAIVKTSMTDVQTGEEGYVTVDVKNIGEAPGTFDIAITCDPPFSVLERPPRISVPPGETRTATGRIRAECSEDTTGSCNIRVYEVEDPSLSATATITGLCKTIILCPIEGQKRCIGNVIEICTSGKWKFFEDCEYGCEIFEGEVRCKQPPEPECGDGVCQPPENYITCPKDCPSPPPQCVWWNPLTWPTCLANLIQSVQFIFMIIGAFVMVILIIIIIYFIFIRR